MPSIHPRGRWSDTRHVLLAPLILAVGVSQLLLSATPTRQPTTETTVALVVAGIAPLVTAALCSSIRPGYDSILVASSFVLTSIGMVSLLALSMAPGPNAPFFGTIVIRHGFFIGGGCLALLAGALFADRLDGVGRYPYSIGLVALALTALTIVGGTTVNGARLWLSIGPITFQPSEISRILIATFVASYLYQRRHLVASPWRIGGVDLPPAPYLIPVAGALLVAIGLLVIQNDLGMAALLSAGMAAGIASALRSRTSTAVILACFALAILASYAVSPRVQSRVDAWLNPWREGATTGYQFIQADYALADGSIWGGHRGETAIAVPEIQTDFVLVAVAGQFGFIVAAAVIASSTVVVLRCIVNGLRAMSGLGTLLCCCFAALLGMQLLLIAGGVLRVLPLTGVTYPLVSYGGTSMVGTLFIVGVVVGIGAEQRVAP